MYIRQSSTCTTLPDFIVFASTLNRVKTGFLYATGGGLLTGGGYKQQSEQRLLLHFASADSFMTEKCHYGLFIAYQPTSAAALLSEVGSRGDVIYNLATPTQPEDDNLITGITERQHNAPTC